MKLNILRHVKDIQLIIQIHTGIHALIISVQHIKLMKRECTAIVRSVKSYYTIISIISLLNNNDLIAKMTEL